MRGRRLSSPLMFQGNGGKLSRRGASFPRRSEVGKTSLPEHATCPEENISGRKRGTMRKWSLGRAGVWESEGRARGQLTLTEPNPGAVQRMMYGEVMSTHVWAACNDDQDWRLGLPDGDGLASQSASPAKLESAARRRRSARTQPNKQRLNSAGWVIPSRRCGAPRRAGAAKLGSRPPAPS